MTVGVWQRRVRVWRRRVGVWRREGRLLASGLVQRMASHMLHQWEASKDNTLT